MDVATRPAADLSRRPGNFNTGRNMKSLFFLIFALAITQTADAQLIDWHGGQFAGRWAMPASVGGSNRQAVGNRYQFSWGLININQATKDIPGTSSQSASTGGGRGSESKGPIRRLLGRRRR